MTDFINDAIEIDTIPKASTLSYEPLSPKHVKSVVIPALLFLSIPLLILSVLTITVGKVTFDKTWWFYPIYGSIALSIMVYTPISVRKKGYALRDFDIHFRKGVIWQQTTSLPYNRIQHVEVVSGPLDRYFDLAAVKIFTAGGGMTDMEIPGLENDRAVEIRDLVIDKAAKARAGKLTADENSAVDAEQVYDTSEVSHDQ